MECEKKSSEISRPLANFHPDVWGDQFFSYTPPDEAIRRKMEQEAELLKEVVRKEILVLDKDPKERLIFLDDILRLGVAYHFENEIEDTFRMFHKKMYNDSSYEDDLYYVALRFRLLRQHGFNASCDVFENFKCENGNFKDFLASDVQGLLSLYEASYLEVHGEKILEEARLFATTHLTTFATQLCTPMAEQVAHALKLPLHRRTIILESRHQISFYESKSCHNETLLKFSKLDFNLLQILHNMELKDLTRWWRSLDMAKKLPFVRDRIVETHFWNLGFYHEPKYSYARILLTKVYKIITILNDMYDAYGTIEELKPFTEAIECLRLERSCINQLPSYMRLAYQIISDTCEEIEQYLALEQRSFAVYYLQQQIKAVCQSYLKEAIWRHKRIVPTYDEYMKNAIDGTAGYKYLVYACFLGMGEIANKDAFEWVEQATKPLKASSTIGRLLNDIASHKFEKKRNHVSSAFDCHMNQFGTSMEEATKEFYSQIEEAWKDINEEILGPKIVTMPLLLRCINYSRTLYNFYQNEDNEDGYTTAKYTQEKFATTLIHPIT